MEEASVPRSFRRLALSLVLVPAAAGSAATIDHGGVACVVAGKFPRIDARIAPADRVAKARAFFHADDDARWYFVEMKVERGVFHGVLPPPLKTTARIHYYLEATDKDVTQNRTQEFAAQVVANAGECPNKGMVAAMAAASKVLVGAPAGASAAPAGFAANGVAAAGAATGGGLGATALVVGGVAVAGGAAVAVAAAADKGNDAGGSGGSQGSSAPIVVEGTVYSDTCCPAGLVDPAPGARTNSRRIQGAVVSSSLDSATTTSDAQGVFRLTTLTRCPSPQPTFTLTVAASGCDTLSTVRSWGCASGGPNVYALNLICR
jgi:hypothetical protein